LPVHIHDFLPHDGSEAVRAGSLRGRAAADVRDALLRAAFDALHLVAHRSPGRSTAATRSSPSPPTPPAPAA